MPRLPGRNSLLATLPFESPLFERGEPCSRASAVGPGAGGSTRRGARLAQHACAKQGEDRAHPAAGRRPSRNSTAMGPWPHPTRGPQVPATSPIRHPCRRRSRGPATISSRQRAPATLKLFEVMKASHTAVSFRCWRTMTRRILEGGVSGSKASRRYRSWSRFWRRNSSMSTSGRRKKSIWALFRAHAAEALTPPQRPSCSGSSPAPTTRTWSSSASTRSTDSASATTALRRFFVAGD